MSACGDKSALRGRIALPAEIRRHSVNVFHLDLQSCDFHLRMQGEVSQWTPPTSLFF
jgi:hypothetical protein